MKKSILSILMLIIAGITTTAMAQEIVQGAAIVFDEDIHDYGDVPHGGNGTFAFVFKNTGSEPLLISNAKGSCGCTVPTWPKEPIAPGASASIDVTYDTQRVGAINKSVTIMSNAVNDPVKVIQIAGTVLAPLAVDGVETIQEEVKPMIQPVKVEPIVEKVIIEPVPMTKEETKAAAKAAKAAAKADKAAAKAKAKADKIAVKAVEVKA